MVWKKVETSVKESPSAKTNPFAIAAAAKKSKEAAANDSAQDVEELIDETPVNSEEKLNAPATKKQKVEEKVVAKPAAKKTPAPAKSKPKKAAATKDEDDDEDDEDEVEVPKLVQHFSKQEFVNASNGKEYSLKISTWNINGIRAWLKVLFKA